MSNPDYDRGLALYRANRLAEALAAYDRALGAEPGHVDTLVNRGITLWGMGRGDEALASTDAALAADPRHREAAFNRAVMLSGMGRLDEALAASDHVLALEPDFAEGHSHRGSVLRELGRLGEALASLEAALRLKPDSAVTQNNRGGLLQQLNRSEEALAAFDAALRLNPRHGNALYNRGCVLEALGRWPEALASFDAALGFGPAHEQLLEHRGDVLFELGRRDEALRSLERAIAAAPDRMALRIKRGGALYESRRLEDALAALDQVLALDPGNADAFYNRARVLADLKRYDEAIADYEKALNRAPDHPYALSGLVSAAQHLCDWARLAQLAPMVEQHVREAKSIIQPFVLLNYVDDPVLHRLCSENYRHHLVPIAPPPLAGASYAHPKIRIAYLSAGFQFSAMAVLMAELFERHDRTQFELHALSFGEDDGSGWRQRLEKAFDHFHDARHLSNIQAAQLLRSLEIDIAVDLMGYTAFARPEILSFRPAPIQVNYLGHPSTMGADFIDYIFGDRIVTPFADEAFYTEKIVQLPDGYWPDNSGREVGQAPTRAEAGLPEEGFVFCSFNIERKLSAPVFAIWMRLLRAIPGSVLWLMVNNDGARAKLRAAAEAEGVVPERIVFAARTDLKSHLARHALADLFLDTLPYNSHTTATDALWTDLPVITCMGKAFPARVAASLLEAVGLPELVTRSPEEYESLALALARDPARLEALRARLAANRFNRPLFDADLLRRNIEAALLALHVAAQNGESPRAFAVTP